MSDVDIEEIGNSLSEQSQTKRVEYRKFEDVPILRPEDFKEGCGLPPGTRLLDTEAFFLKYLGKVIEDTQHEGELEFFYNNDSLKAAKELNTHKLQSWGQYESYEITLMALEKMAEDYPNFTLFRGTDFSPGEGFRGLDYSPNAEEAMSFAISHKIRKEPVLVMINVANFVKRYRETTKEGNFGRYNHQIDFRTEGNWWRHSFEIIMDPSLQKDVLEVRRIPDNPQERQAIADRYKEAAIKID